MDRIIDRFTRTCRLTVAADRPERFLNVLNDAGIGFWDIRRPDVSTISIVLKYRDSSEASAAAARMGGICKIDMLNGMTFLFKNLFVRRCLAVLALSYTFILAVSSLYILGDRY